MKKPNYNMERKDRERAKQEKATAKVAKRAVKGEESPQSEASPMENQVDPETAQTQKSDD